MKRILIVEDDADLSKIMTIRLAQLGYAVEVAEDGMIALDKLPSFKPDLMVLDVMLPKLDGVSLNRKLKDDPGLKALPIIVLTGKIGVKEMFVINDQLSVSAFFQKPVSLGTLSAKIKELLGE